MLGPYSLPLRHTPDEVVHVVVVTSCLLLIRHDGLRARKAVVCCADAVRVADGQACASCVPAATQHNARAFNEMARASGMTASA